MVKLKIQKLIKILLLVCVSYNSFAQETKIDTSVHRIKKGIDIPVTVLGVAGTVYGVYLRQNKPNIDSVVLVSLNPTSLAPIDRKVIYNNDYTAGKVSDYFLGAGFVLPWLLAFDKDVNNELGKYTLLYFETMALAGTEYWATAGMVDKYRPYVYNPNVPFARRLSKHSKNSFFAGHVTITAAGTFFTAQVYNDLHPDSKFRWWAYGIASALTATNGYLRYKGGFHFFSDILIGTAAGTATGILVPVLHRNKHRDKRMSIMPFSGDTHGVYMSYKF